MDEISRLRRLLEESERQREESERQRKGAEIRVLEEQRLREEEQRRREEAEDLAKTSRPQVLQQYLEACHSLSLAIQVVTDRSLTTQGDTTDPTGRIFPCRIIPWDDFARRQEKIWDQLLVGYPFYSRAVFPSSHQLEYVASLISPISSEIGLRHFERDTVENAVQKLVDEAYGDLSLRDSLGLQGSVTFESHTNLSNTVGAVSESFEQMSIGGDDGAEATTPALTQPGPRARRQAKKGKGKLADQFCIYRTSDGRNIPALAIEYKAPHKLTRDEIVSGLASEIQPERDVINKDGEDFAFASRSLVAAVVTQLFSYMLGRGIQYGYICTGEAFVFLHIPDDPTIVYYSVCVPNLDVLDDDENRLHRTAVAQVFAFVLQALRVSPPPPSWHDRAANLDTWAVEYEDVLKNIPETIRKQPRASPYKPQRWKGFQRSPIRTRSRCQQPNSNVIRRDEDDEEEGPPPSPSARQSSRSRQGAAASTSTTGQGGKQDKGGKRNRRIQQGPATRQNIQDRPFCTQQCLLGLANGGPMDEECPNFHDHGRRHIDRRELLRLIRVQLAEDRGPDADAIPLYLSGSVGSLFKVRLSSHGYTLVAKGVEECDLARILHENEIYDRLRPIQGKHVPVCLGKIDLILPYYYDGGVFTYFMFLSWAGRPLFDSADQINKANLVKTVTTAFTEIHGLQVLHRDAELRNVLYDPPSGNLMIVDFERAELRDRQALCPISPNRKRKYGVLKKRGRDDFTIELQSIKKGIMQWIK
ncbi:hypothetical protein DL766_008357 [Monosporascus sp. MC13-8B]|nr:hypothetical protein DL766_008357 [Monosporascus sp. MC13-8B]